MSNATESYREGRLAEAIAAANEEVKRNPTDVARRGFLFELLVLDGNFERADAQLETVAAQSSKSAATTASLRQVLRAEIWRREFWTEGRVPEFVEPPAEWLQMQLRASIALRAGESQEALELLERANELRPANSGKCDGGSFEDACDLDDRIGAVCEMLTATGKYYWVPFARLRWIEFDAPRQALDITWRPARVEFASGVQGRVFVPVVYAPIEAKSEDALKLARRTDWSGGEGTPVRGHGQRVLSLGGEEHGLLELSRLEFSAA